MENINGAATVGYERERKTNRLNMRVSNSEMELLNKMSYENDESISQIVRKAIKAYVKNYEGFEEVT